MKSTNIATLLTLTALLTACGQKAGDNASAPAATGPEAGMHTMGNAAEGMDQMATAQTVKGTGTVTAVDKAAGTITIDHAPIPEANWPAMTMAFMAKPALLDSVKAGDAIGFDLELKGGAGEVTKIEKR